MQPALEQSCGKQTPSASISFFHTHSLYISNIKRKVQWDLGLFTISVLAKRMLPHDGDFQSKNMFGRQIRQKMALHGGILSASTTLQSPFNCFSILYTICLKFMCSKIHLKCCISDAGWRRLIGCLTSCRSFSAKKPLILGCVRTMTSTDMASYWLGF